MFTESTYRKILIPQIACGNSILSDLLQEKFTFLFIKNQMMCNANLTHIKMQLDLIEIAQLTVRNKIDFLKRVEDGKSSRQYDDAGYIDATSERKSQSHAEAYSRARSNQRFKRTSESHDRARSDAKSEHKGESESRAYDKSRTTNKSDTLSKFTSDGYSVGRGKGASCSATRAESQSVSTTGNMSSSLDGKYIGINAGTNAYTNDDGFLGAGCESVDRLASEANLIGSGSFINEMFRKIGSVLSGFSFTDIGNALLDFVGVPCGTQGMPSDTIKEMQARSGVERDTSGGLLYKPMSVGINGSILGVPIPPLQIQGRRTFYTNTALPELSTIPSMSPIGYSAEVLAKNEDWNSCERGRITPSSGRSWSYSYKFGVSFGVGLATFNFTFNLRTQISFGGGYKETEVCTSGASSRVASSETSSVYKEVGIQKSQGHSNTDEKATNVHDSERKGTSFRDAYSNSSSASTATMDSEGQSHTDAKRRARSESEGYGSNSSRREGHSSGYGKSINRSEALIESRMYSQIFANLEAMWKRIMVEYKHELEDTAGSLGFETLDAQVIDTCEDFSCANTFGTINNGLTNSWNY